MRLQLIKNPDDGLEGLDYGYKSYSSFTTVGNWYEGDLTPTIYNPSTLEPAGPAYIIMCDDGRMRKINAEFFITIDELREKKLNEILDENI